jgi:KH/beta-lactamase-domain protein
MPKEAEITRIEFEGPRLAIYVKNVALLLEQSHIVTEIVNLLHKRVVIRSDPSIRLHESESERLIKSTVPAEAEITEINFDPTLGEVVIEAKKPGLAIGKDGVTLQDIIKTTSWRPRVLRAPPLPSKIIASTRHIIHSESEARSRIFRDVGERIFRQRVTRTSSVFFTPLGGFHEVGRSAMLVETDESCVVMDCGISAGADRPAYAYPRVYSDEFYIDKLDAVIISHAHLDHCGFVPFLFKYGYDGPIYCSEPTSVLMTLLQLDYLDIFGKEGGYAPYDQKDVREAVLHTIPVKYGVVTDVAPDIKLTLHNAGHIVGSSIVHLHIGEGLHNIVYTGDFKFGRTMLLEPATYSFPRAETLIMESTYGGPDDVMSDRETVEGRLAKIVNEVAEKGGKILIPTLAVGRAQEIMLVLNAYMKNKTIKELPIFLEGMIYEATAIHTAYPEYLARDLREQILYKDINPFQSDYFTAVDHPSEREKIAAGEPAVILATSGMMEGGPAIDYFRYLASDERNAVVFVSYQVEGTLGNRLKNGVREVSLMNRNGKLEAYKVNLRVDSVEGFSGHSDRNQLLGFLRRVSPRPSRVFLGHGERRKTDMFAHQVSRILKLRTVAPDVLETIRLR